jgi:tetratricopeptide (TPR) repeat protein
LADRIGDKRLVGYGLVTRALHRFAFCLHEDVLETGREGTRLLREEGDLWDVCTLLAFMEGASLELGRLRLSSELSDEVEAMATRLGHTFALEVIHGSCRSGRRLVLDPDLAVFEASARRHLEMAGPMGFRHIYGGFLAQAVFLKGDWEEALVLAEEAVRHAPEHHHTSGSEWSTYLRILAYLGRPAEVIGVLDDRRADLPQLGRPNGYGPSYLPAAAIEALSVIGERDKAAEFYPLVRELIATTGVVLHWWGTYLLERIAGIGAAAGEQWDAAEQHFQTALRQAEELPFEIDGAETRRWYARMLLDRNGGGDRDQARSLLEQAIPVYRRIGMVRHEELAGRLLAP